MSRHYRGSRWDSNGKVLGNLAREYPRRGPGDPDDDPEDPGPWVIGVTRPAVPWDCPAYGPDGPARGRICFFADEGTRNCRTAGECAMSVAMLAEQTRPGRPGQRSLHYDEGGRCAADGQDWPCTPSLVLAALDDIDQAAGITPDGGEEP